MTAEKLGSFEDQFTRFAQDFSDLLSGVFNGVPDVVAKHLDERSQIFVEVPLCVGAEELAKLKVDVWCCPDSDGTYLAVHESTYQLIASLDRAPIIRFEYEREGRTKPRAHVQVHAHRGALSHLLSRSGHPSPHSMESLHPPVGGERFRPILEDVIEFLVVECRFTALAGWRIPVAEGRERWRRLQTRTAVRDCPSEAVVALRSLGFQVSTRPAPHDRDDNTDRLRRW
jgi:hypothetical protein